MDEVPKLRLAAQQARSLAQNLAEADAKTGFIQLAEKWEAMADRLEMAHIGVVAQGRSL
jgi:hypothetical protein